MVENEEHKLTIYQSLDAEAMAVVILLNDGRHPP